jgi:hypothetical protein
VLDANLVHRERDPLTGEEKETFVPGVFQGKGVKFALESANQSSESLWFQAAMCVGYGMSREDALASVTTSAAAILGLEDRVGSLAVGHDGNVVLFSGDPLSVTSFVEYVVLGGDLVYERAKDVRAKHLLEGLEPPNTAPASAEGEGPGDSDEEGEKGAEKKDDEDEKEGDQR